MRGQDPGSEHERETDNSASPPMPPPSFGQSSGWDTGQVDTPPWGTPGSSGGVGGAPEPERWQPPPAFTAAAAGMQVWRGPSADPSPTWPAATGEPIGEAWPGHSPAASGLGTFAAGPATTAPAAQDPVTRVPASGLDYPIPGVATPPHGMPDGAFTAHNPAGLNDITPDPHRPRFTLPEPSSGPTQRTGAPGAVSGLNDSGSDPHRPRFILPEPSSGPTQRTGAPGAAYGTPGLDDTATNPYQPGFIPPEPTSGPTHWAGDSEPGHGMGSGGQDSRNAGWAPGSASPAPAGPASPDWSASTGDHGDRSERGGAGTTSPWPALPGASAIGSVPREEDPPRQGSHVARHSSAAADPRDIPVWPPPGAASHAAPTDDPPADATPQAEITMPVPRQAVAKPGESEDSGETRFSASLPPKLPAIPLSSSAAQGRPTVANPMGHPPLPALPARPTVADPVEPSSSLTMPARPTVADPVGQSPSSGPQERPTVANPVLPPSASTPSGRPTVADPVGLPPAPGSSGFPPPPPSPAGPGSSSGPATVAGPFVGFSGGGAPPGGAGQGSRAAFTPSSTAAQPRGFGSPRPTPAPGGGTGKKALIGAAIVIAIGAIGVGAYFAYQGLGDQPGAQALGRVPSVVTPPQPEVSTAGQEALDSAETDPKEMTPAEAFPSAKVTINGRTYKRVKVNSTEKCEQGAAGEFAEALKDQKCGRLLRATYVDGRRKYAVTTGIAVLPTKDAAVKVDAAKDLAANVWFRGLPGPSGSGGERVQISGGYAAGLVWGRYIVFSYATYADGHTPKAKEKDLDPISDAFRQNTSKVIEKRAAAS